MESATSPRLRGTTRRRDDHMATSRGRRAELKKLNASHAAWRFYRVICQFRFGYLAFLVLMVILMFSFTLLMEIFFAIFLPSARVDPNFTVRSICLLAALPFLLILLSYLFEESVRLFFDAIDKSEGSLRNFRLSVAVVIHYLRHKSEMPDDRYAQHLHQTLSADAAASSKGTDEISTWRKWARKISSIFVASDPFDDANKEKEDDDRELIEEEMLESQEKAAASAIVAAATDASAASRWKKALGAATTAGVFKKTSFDGPPMDFSTLVAVDVLCPVLFEVVTLVEFVYVLLSTLSPMDAFLSYLQTGFFFLFGYLALWIVCHFWSSRNQKMREFVSNYRRRHRDVERQLREIEEEKKSAQLWLMTVGFRATEYFAVLLDACLRSCCRRRARHDGEGAGLLAAPATAASTIDEDDATARLARSRERVRELYQRSCEWNPWRRLSYNQRLLVLTPLVLVGALVSFSHFLVGWSIMGVSLVLLAYTIQRRFPQVFGSTFRAFITTFVVLSFVFFSSTWAIGTFVIGGDFKVLPPTPASQSLAASVGPSTTSANAFQSTAAAWGAIAKYPVCSLDFNSLDIVDFALIADAVYGVNSSIQQQALGERFNGTALGDWRYVARNNESAAHQVWAELSFPSANLTVVAVRGTASATDALEDLHFWFGISTIQALDVFFPFLKQLPSAFVVKLLSMDIFRPLMPPPVYAELLAHVVALKQRLGDGQRLVLTGHSLGGAMAAMVGAKTKTPAVSFSGPGLLYTRGRFDIDDQDIRDYVLTIKPRHDLVPQVDQLGGMVQEIECRKSNPMTCHSTITHICELYTSCGDKRGRDWSKATQCDAYLKN